MDENEKLQQLQEFYIKNLPDNFRVLEEAIDIKVQHEYIACNKSISKVSMDDSIQELISSLELTDTEEAKSILIKLARSSSIEAYRAIEGYLNNITIRKMKAWATLALQESRMGIESDLLDEPPVFISTGLGGKGQSIRFFFVLILRDKEATFTQSQKKITKLELEIQLKNNGGELEKLQFVESFGIGTFFFPLKSQLQNVIHDTISECNQYGNFLRKELIITNVMKMNLKEIKQFIEDRDNNTE